MRPRLTLNGGVRYDLQYLQTIRTDTDNLSPRVGFAWSPLASGTVVVRGSAGLFFDRVPLRALANALLSANNTSDVANLRQNSVILVARHRPAHRCFPISLPRPIPSVTLPNLTTMNPAMQNASLAAGEASRSSSRSASAARQRRLPVTRAGGTDHLGEPERAVVRRRRHQQRLPSESRATATTARYSPSAPSPSYHGLHVSFVQRPTRWDSIASRTPIEGDGQRRRVLLQLADRSVRPLEGLGPLG